MRLLAGLVLFLTCFSGRAFAQADGVSIVPRPRSVQRGKGVFTLTGRTTIWTDRRDSAVAARFARELAPGTGFALRVRVGTSSSGSRIEFRHSGDTAIGPEGYRLAVKPGVVTIVAATPAGAFYATRSLLQLLPPDVFRAAPVAGVRWTMPAVSIADRPRFEWRGMHLDVARHFMPKEFVKKYIDLLALHKMNRFHWHLTDDQGWRLEIEKYPLLTAVGAWRDSTIIGHQSRDTTNAAFDHTRHGGYYTQDDAREIVAYAAERFVTVVPEIEMPGHSQAAIAAYPQLGNTGDHVKPWTMWGVSNYILNPSDSTIAFMEDVLKEVMAIFPSPYIHTGGDEAPKTQWKASPLAQTRIRQLGLKDEDELQAWFTKQMDAFLTSHGRRLVGWDEILEGGLAPNAVVMSWRGTQGGIAAANAGHDVVMTPGSYTYFDHYQSRNTAAEPLAFGGFVPLDTVYSYEPVPSQLGAAAARHILGAQGQVWTEYIPDPKQAEYMAFPREAALAEALWTPRDRRDFADFVARLDADLARLRALDVHYRPLDRATYRSAEDRYSDRIARLAPCTSMTFTVTTVQKPAPKNACSIALFAWHALADSGARKLGIRTLPSRADSASVVSFAVIGLDGAPDERYWSVKLTFAGATPPVVVRIDQGSGAIAFGKSEH